MTQSYITIINALNQFADNHLGIQRFKASFFEQIDNFSSSDNVWPILYAVPSDVSFDEYVGRFFFRVYVVDVLQKDRSNESAILNDTLLTLRDLYNWIKIADNGLNVLSTGRAVPVNNFLVDYTAGWYLDIEIEGQVESNDCSIPFSSNFILTGYTCDYTYANQFLTCETLEDCAIIIDLQAQIDAIQLSADTFVTNGSYDNPSGTLSLVRNDGNILSITGFTTGATGGPDIYVTGGTFNTGTETLTLSRNDNQNVIITGFTSGVGFDVFVTGGTYNNGDILFTNNTGGTFNVSGLFTGETFTDVFVTGGTFNSGTGAATFINNTGGTFNVTGFITSGGTIVDKFVTGFTYSNNQLTIKQNEGVADLSVVVDTFTGLTINGSLSATTYLGLPTNISDAYIFSSNNSDISGYEQAVILLLFIPNAIASIVTNVSTSPTLLANFATNLGYPNTTVIPSGVVTIHFETEKNIGGNAYQCFAELYKRNLAGTETLFGTSDLTSEISTNVLIQQTVSVVLPNNISILTTDRIVVKIYANVTSGPNRNITVFYDDNTNSRLQLPVTSVSIAGLIPYTGATTNVNLGSNSLSAATLSATTYLGLPLDVFVTGGTYNNGTGVATYTNNTGGTFNVSGFSTGGGSTFTGGTVTGPTNFTNGLTANTFSATTYFNLPTDIRVTGGTYNPSTGTATLTNNTGGTFTLSGFITSASTNNFKSSQDSSGVTGTTNVVHYTQLIPANSYAANDIIRVTFRGRKTGTAGNPTYRIYVNSTPDLAGTPILIGGFTPSTTTFLASAFIRHLSIKNASNNTEVFLATNNATSIDVSNVSSLTTCAINWTLDRHFIFAIQGASANDTQFASMYLIEKL